MTDIDGEQPRCEECGVLMRDIPGGWECPACGHVLMLTMQEQEWTFPDVPDFPDFPDIPDFDGPSIHGG